MGPNIREGRRTSTVWRRSPYYYSDARRHFGSSWRDSRSYSYISSIHHQQFQQGREGIRWSNIQACEQPLRRKKVLKEIEGDLFTAPRTSSLAHCVAEDMRMGAGIAVKFREMFKRKNELLAQGARTGQVAVLKDRGRFIYYLVTKSLSKGKPHLEDLRSSLIHMRQHMLINNVHEVAMPRIGCGLDRLKWYDVKMMLIEIFGEDDVTITVYSLNKHGNSTRRQKHGNSTSSRGSNKQQKYNAKMKSILGEKEY